MKIVYFSAFYFTALVGSVQVMFSMQDAENMLEAVKKFNNCTGPKYINIGYKYQKYDAKQHEKLFKDLEHAPEPKNGSIIYESQSLIDKSGPAINIGSLQKCFGEYFKVDKLCNDFDQLKKERNNVIFFTGFALGGVTFFALNYFKGYIQTRQ